MIAAVPGRTVILLTAKREESDRVVGLRRGGDDYVVKPFCPPSWWRASTPSCAAPRRPPRRRPLRFGALEIDAAAQLARVEG
jgi:two-component system, OmpR family, response regulator ResD